MRAFAHELGEKIVKWVGIFSLSIVLLQLSYPILHVTLGHH